MFYSFTIFQRAYKGAQKIGKSREESKKIATVMFVFFGISLVLSSLYFKPIVLLALIAHFFQFYNEEMKKHKA